MIRLGLKLVASATAALALGALAGCSQDVEEDDTADDTAAIMAASGPLGPSLFRNDFYTYLKTEGHLTEDQIRQLVFIPTTKVIAPQVGVDPNAPLASHDHVFAGIKPTDLYNAGLRAPLELQQGPDSDDLEGELRARPVHIVIVPGIFGEFIPVSPFEEIFDVGGTAKLDFEDKVDALAASDDPEERALATDKQYSVTALGDVDKSLKSVMRVGSIDAADGTPLVTVTYLKPELGSLETFGTLDENADYYLPRLEKYFKVIGVPSHLYVMGYSRGMATALNLVSRAKDESASWLPKLEGVIGLAGVIYGSQLADAAMAPGPQHDLIALMQDFVDNELESCAEGETSPSTWLVTKNVGHYTAFGTRAALLARKLGNHDEELAREGVETSLANVGSFASFTKRALLGDPKRVFDTDGINDGVTSGVLHLGSPNAEYCANIERFKTTARQIIKGVETLTTDSRLDWWRTHTLPANVRYFAITGTMGDATAAGAEISPLVKNTLAYDPHSVDFRNLRGNYYDLLGASGTQLQDSQVPVQRGRFWDDVNRVLNPSQAPLRTYFMGTVGIHHWGLSFPRAFATHDGLDANPFPRTLLLKSIATYVAQVDRHGG